MRNLIFLNPIETIPGKEKLLESPSLENLMNFQDPYTLEMIIKEECADLGKIYLSKDLEGKNIREYIKSEVAIHKPDWVIAVGLSATGALPLKNQKKILLNPQVNIKGLEKENISDFDIENTHGLFDEKHKKDYEVFSSFFNNADLFEDEENLDIFTYDDFIRAIINEFDK